MLAWEADASTLAESNREGIARARYHLFPRSTSANHAKHCERTVNLGDPHIPIMKWYAGTTYAGENGDGYVGVI